MDAGASSSSARRMTRPVPTGRRRPCQASGRWPIRGTSRITPTSRCHSPSSRRISRHLNPTGVYEREFEVPAAGWRRAAASCSTSVPPRACSSPQLNGDEIGVGKDSHLASEFDLTGLLHAGPEHPPADGREVVRRELRGRPGPVVARRNLPPGLHVRHPRRPSCRRPRQRRPDRHDLSMGTLDLTVTVGFPGRELPSGWTVEATLDGTGRAHTAPAEIILKQRNFDLVHLLRLHR